MHLHAHLQFRITVGDDDAAVLEEAAADDELAVEEVVELLEAASDDGTVLHAYGHVEGCTVGTAGLVLGKFSTRFLNAGAGKEADDDGGSASFLSILSVSYV